MSPSALSGGGSTGVGLTATVPARVEIYEVGPRDGLQNELRSLPTEDKLRLIEALVTAGLRRIEVTSFVSPRWIPQLADADKLLRALPHREGVVFSGLVPNLRGLERAKNAGLEEASFFLSVSESHSRKNINKSVAEALSVWRAVSVEARRLGMRLRCYLSTVWGCPYEGAVPISSVIDVVKRTCDAEFDQLSLGDTIGAGTPLQTAQIVSEVSQIVPCSRLALHLHDTRGTALANALVGLSMGITCFDSSVGGLGGCPYAPGAAGNLATEDLLYMLHGMGVETGVELSRLVDAAELAQELIGRRLPGKYLQAALGARDRRGAVGFPLPPQRRA
jgi:hydroxymethylglutaryl-CoA lyase